MSPCYGVDPSLRSYTICWCLTEEKEKEKDKKKKKTE